jgi:hypothetical protein
MRLIGSPNIRRNRSLGPAHFDRENRALAEGVGVRRAKGNVGWHAFAGFVRTGVTPGYDTRSYQSAFAVEALYTSVTPIMLNNEASSFSMPAIAFAPSNKIDSTRAPSGSWVSGSLGATAAARYGTNRPRRTRGTKTAVTGVAATDGGSLPYLFARSYIGTGPHTQYGNSSQFNAVGQGTLAANGFDIWPDRTAARTAHRPLAVNDKSGDFVTTNQAGFTSLGTAFGLPAIEFEVEYTVPVINVCALGDSITEGDAASITVLSPLHYAVDAVSTAGRPVIPSNQGFSSQATSNFVSRLQDMIADGCIIDILVYSAWSPNDQYIVDGNAGSLANWDTAIALMQTNLDTVKSICAANSILLIVGTGVPYAYDASHDAKRVAFNTSLKAQASGSLLIVDYDATVTDGATPAKMQTALTDGASGALHPYDAGYIAMGTALASTLTTALARFAA